MEPCTSPSCLVCGKSFAIDELTPAAAVIPPVAKLVARDHSSWSSDGWICGQDLARYRAEYLQRDLAGGFGVISDLESAVLRSVREEQVVAEDLNRKLDRDATLATRVCRAFSSASGGILFATLLLAGFGVWLAIGASRTPEPASGSPVLRWVHLALSGLVALQAPLILAGLRNREARDRLWADTEYKRSLRAEITGRHLEAKLDHLLVLHARERSSAGTNGCRNGGDAHHPDAAGGVSLPGPRSRAFAEEEPEEEPPHMGHGAPRSLKLVP